jgi:3'-5' exoribonuclease
MIGHHSERNGNLRHTIEVAEQMIKLCRSSEHANFGLSLFSALIHDAGKADEYVMNSKGRWDMSFRGKMLGHKFTAVEWVIESVSKYNIQLPKHHYESVLHILTAVPNAPDWMGLKTPLLTESFLLSMADRLSGHNDLMEKTLTEAGSFGKYHKHLKFAPFKVSG